MKHVAVLIAIPAFLMLVAPGDAQANDQLGLGIRAVTAGKQLPAVLIQPRVGVKSLVIVLTDTATGKTRKLKAKRVKPGVRKELRIKHPTGHFSWKAEGVVHWVNGNTQTFKSTFTTTRVGKLSIQITPADVDMDTRKFQFRATNPIKKATLTVIGEGGKQLGEAEEEYEGNVPGQALQFDWSGVAKAGDILFLDLKVWDVANFWVALRITPFTIEIPHDDVEFASGSAAIRKAEAPKLQSTMALINDALAKHGTLLQLKLFVAGYTDTVSDKASNKQLSRQRARSICAWFRRNGLKIPLYYQGFGESVLAVPTKDNVAEPRNRRALYVLSSQTPGVSAQIPNNVWKKL